MQIETIAIEKPEDVNLILGQAHFIKTVEDLHEALVNAARHGGASAARVNVEERDERLAIAVADNGRGFPFRGRFDLAALNGMAAGPVSLKERVAALRGSLAIDSSASGARLDIALPLSTATV